MIISVYDGNIEYEGFGIGLAGIEGLGVGADWGRVPPGGRSLSHRHDETEMFVIVQGRGELVVDGARHPVAPGSLALFEPFESHVLENTGDTDLVFLTQYWRDADRALVSARSADRLGFGERPVFVCSPPPTPNGDLHLGHLSGPYLGADAYVRFQRMNGVEAWHVTGSDDHQSYVQAAARAEDRATAVTAAHYSAEIADTLALMDIRVDQYTVPHRDEAYRAGLRAYFSRLIDSGVVAPRADEALFDAETGEYLYEVDVSGTCPTCASTTGGNMCEGCGEPNTVIDLADAASALSAAGPRRGPITRYTLPLHDFHEVVIDHHRHGRVPARLRELTARVFDRPSLNLPVSHPASWGTPPAEEHEGTEGQVIWAWVELSYGFLQGIQALGGRLSRNWRVAEPGQDWKIVHFLGYDNAFYHSVLAPVLYKAAFPEWAPDIDYHVNEFYLLEGSKFSTSRRHAIWGKEILGPDSVDAVRYFLSSTRPEGDRTNFASAEYDALVRGTLIGTWQEWLNDLGERMVERYDGVAPDAGNWTPEHSAFLGTLGVRLSALTSALSPDGFSLRRAAAELHGLVEDTVRFSRQESPLAATRWSDDNRTVIALELAAARLLAHGAAPLMPRFAARLGKALGLGVPAHWPRTVELLPPGTQVDLAGTVFFAPPAPVPVPAAPTRS
ncbi:class I tRNA ligase family protein [Streptomyces sp. CRN 30]|uniref:class I tRNA ligase family protein n=1 Tax=Streptomyces sp. CRN 30 TaxID=3075613 RepID=UPI002A80C2A8|nr:class I tRNA ligase family protein [Streptomyces sp. CRN 30]